MQPTRRLDNLVSGGLVALALLIALVEPVPVVRSATAEHRALPGVTYRVERRWRLVTDEEIALQADDELAGFQNLRPPPLMRKGDGWMKRTWNETRRGFRHWFADQQHRSRLVDFYRTLPTNWYLTDLGLARNDKPLPLPPDLAASIWQHQALRDQQAREWACLFFRTPTDLYDHPRSGVISFDDDVDDTYAELIADATARALVSELEFPTILSEIAVDTYGTIEAVYIAPYLLLIEDGVLIGVLGGDGRFDRIPTGWEYLQRQPDSSASL